MDSGVRTHDGRGGARAGRRGEKGEEKKEEGDKGGEDEGVGIMEREDDDYEGGEGEE